MKFDGVKNEEVNMITLKHRGKDLNFECFVKPVSYAPRLDLIPDKKVEIVFDDIREIESMIEMLSRMKEMCLGYIGSWRIGKE